MEATSTCQMTPERLEEKATDVSAMDELDGAARGARADARRNRDRLLRAAKAALAELGAGVSLEEIARRAGVGIATLYRNFPSREAILEAVYRRDVEYHFANATKLLETMAPGDALHEWMRRALNYAATKKGMSSALASITDGSSELYAYSSKLYIDAVTMLVQRATESGDIREGVDPVDLLGALGGLAHGSGRADWQVRALRLLDILMDGLRYKRPTRRLGPEKSRRTGRGHLRQ
jgi:AcrR family transcriptional regulator